MNSPRPALQHSMSRSVVDTRVWAIGDLEAPGALERMLQRVSRPPDVGCTPSASCSAQRELILLHANHRRLRLLVNLAAQLRALRLDHTLALGFGASLCDALRRAAQPLACAHSSYMQRGALAEAAAQLPSKHIAWLQRWYYLRRLLEANVRVVALDTDMAITADPFPLLRDPAWLGARRARHGARLLKDTSGTGRGHAPQARTSSSRRTTSRAASQTQTSASSACRMRRAAARCTRSSASSRRGSLARSHELVKRQALTSHALLRARLR